MSKKGFYFMFIITDFMRYKNILFIVLFGLLLTACGGGNSTTNNSTEPIVKKLLR